MKDTKVISGRIIKTIKGNRGWLTCILNDGEKITISFKMLFQLFDKFDLKVEKYGDHYRTIEFKE